MYSFFFIIKLEWYYIVKKRIRKCALVRGKKIFLNIFRLGVLSLLADEILFKTAKILNEAFSFQSLWNFPLVTLLITGNEEITIIKEQNKPSVYNGARILSRCRPINLYPMYYYIFNLMPLLKLLWNRRSTQKDLTFVLVVMRCSYDFRRFCYFRLV